MTGTSWGKFFWNDWQGDPCLRLCGLAAQGLWMRMLCLAAESDPIGYVKIAGRPCTAQDLVKLTGESNETVDRLLSELETNGVFSRTRGNVIYSRRMVRDSKRSAKARETGKLGGNPTLSKQNTIPPPVNPEDKAGVVPRSQKPEANSQKVAFLVSEVTRSLTKAPGAGTAANYDDPAVRKQRWVQKVSDELRRTLSVDRAEHVILGYQRGEKWAKDEFERADRNMRKNRAGGRAP